MDRRDALKALIALPAVKSIAVADLRPTDTVVIECDGPLSHADCERLQSQFQAAFPGRKALVLTMGMRLKIARDFG